MKRGFQIQKVSVINNLDRYMTEAGANEELYTLIINSMVGWDWPLQIECAESFIKPLELGLINQKNIEKTISEAIRILKDDLSEMNERLLDSWVKVLETCVCRVDMAFVSQNVIQQIMDIVSQQNPLPKRMHGNRMVFTVAKSVGEKGIDKDAQIQRLINNICGDGNYKIRRGGI